jgi:sterol desaturase/sphingolipid hydroxylase (fatty acid hydroxylase superfamily)
MLQALLARTSPRQQHAHPRTTDRLVLYLILALFGLSVAVERLRPGWQLPVIPGWWTRAVAINAVQLAVVVLAGLSWERWLSGSSLFSFADAWPAWCGGLVAYLIATFVFYWWHRARHEVDALWRLHQIHHSAARLEVFTSFYKHPVEMVVNSLIGSVLVYALLGLDPAAGAYYTLFTAAGELFYHANVRTPHWVGWVFQRPEMHRIHHEHGKHRHNYADIVWWDMLFGTYENPRDWQGRCGFEFERERRLADMLCCRDVHEESSR